MFKYPLNETICTEVIFVPHRRFMFTEATLD